MSVVTPENFNQYFDYIFSLYLSLQLPASSLVVTAISGEQCNETKVTSGDRSTLFLVDAVSAPCVNVQHRSVCAGLWRQLLRAGQSSHGKGTPMQPGCGDLQVSFHRKPVQILKSLWF